MGLRDRSGHRKPLVLNSVVTLLSKGLPGLLPLIFSGLALRALLTRDVRTWFFPAQPSAS